MNNQTTQVQLDVSIEATFRGMLWNCEDSTIEAAWNLVENGADIEGVLHACVGFNTLKNNEEYLNSYLKAKAL